MISVGILTLFLAFAAREDMTFLPAICHEISSIRFRAMRALAAISGFTLT